MTSEERRKIRYIRRHDRREYRKTHAQPWPDNYERKCQRTGGRFNSAPRPYTKTEKWRSKVSKCDNFDWVFSHSHIWGSHFKCRKGKSWKGSVQRFTLRAPMTIGEMRKRLMALRYKLGGLTCFWTRERGTLRFIRAQKYNDRVISYCFYANCILPGICRHFIYDNGASLENKGQSFTVRRAIVDLRNYHLKYGNQGYVLLFDFKKFFDSVPHDVVKRSIRKAFTDGRIVALADQMIDQYGAVGLGLGSPVNQALALESADLLDHYIQERLTAEAREVFGPDIPPVGRYYARYMDDGRLYYPRKDVLKWALERIREVCASIGITLNAHKTQIAPIKRFTWLKIKFILTDSGKIIRKIDRRSVVRQRRKLKKLRARVDAGKMPESAVYASFQSWVGHAKQFNAYRSIVSMTKLYCSLYSYRPKEGVINIRCGRYYITAA